MAKVQDKHINQDDDVLSALPDGQTPASNKDDQEPPKPKQRQVDKGDLVPVPVPGKDTFAALDELFSKTVKSQADGSDDDAQHSDGDAPANGDGASAADDKSGEDKASSDAKDKAAKEKADDKEVKPGKAEDKADDKAGAAKPPVKDIFDSVELPPQAKARSGEAFSKVKELARQQVKERDEKLAKLTTEIEQLRADVSNRPPAEAAKELEELRNWRNQIDVEADPKWKEQFDGRIAKNDEQIYSKLKEAGMSDAKVEEIKKMGGPQVLEWEPILPKLPPQLRRFIETKLVENESLSEDRKAAIAAAKAKATEFIQARSTEQAALAKNDRSKSQATVDKLVKEIKWWDKKVELPADATPEQKADAEAETKFMANAKAMVKDFLDNPNPELYGELVIGTVLAHRYNAELQSLRAASDAALKKLEADLKTANDELARIKKSTSGRRESSAPPKPVARNGTNFQERAGDALDRLRAELNQD